jgi:hypothetical protein
VVWFSVAVGPFAAIRGFEISAWSTTQALLALQQQLSEWNDVKLVVYAIITADVDRNYLRKSWLEHIEKSRGLRVPSYDLVNGSLAFQGLADAKQDGLEDSEDLRNKEMILTKLMLARMASLSAERSIPFIVVYLPTEDKRDFSALIARTVGEDRLVDLRPTINPVCSRFVFDAHPSPDCHRRIAQALEPIVRKALD